MTHFTDLVRTGAAGSMYDTTGRTIPGYTYTEMGGFANGPCQRVLIGAPIALSATAVCAAQAVAGAGNATINGASASGGVATFDVARAVSIVSANAGDTTQTVTVTGTDIYGQSLRETISLNGTTTVNGKKAFLTVTQVTVSAATAGNLSVGSTDIFGLPFYATNRDHYLIYWNNVLLTSTGTFTAGVTSTATATTGDVRGTYLVPDASNGTKRLTVFYFPISGSTTTNIDTVTNLYGVAQF